MKTSLLHTLRNMRRLTLAVAFIPMIVTYILPFLTKAIFPICEGGTQPIEAQILRICITFAVFCILHFYFYRSLISNTLKDAQIQRRAWILLYVWIVINMLEFFAEIYLSFVHIEPSITNYLFAPSAIIEQISLLLFFFLLLQNTTSRYRTAYIFANIANVIIVAKVVIRLYITLFQPSYLPTWHMYTSLPLSFLNVLFNWIFYYKLYKACKKEELMLTKES